VKQIEDGLSTELVMVSRRELLDWCEQPLVISSQGLDSRALKSFSLNKRT